MAKPTKFSEEDPQAEEPQAERNYIAAAEAWDNVEGQEFGGKADVVDIKIGEVAGPFVYLNHVPMETRLGNVTVHQATTEDGDTVRLPISATFVRAVDQAKLAFGDTFLVKRLDDVKKKQGKGAGNMIPVYAIKILSHGPAAK